MNDIKYDINRQCIRAHPVPTPYAWSRQTTCGQSGNAQNQSGVIYIAHSLHAMKRLYRLNASPRPVSCYCLHLNGGNWAAKGRKALLDTMISVLIMICVPQSVIRRVKMTTPHRTSSARRRAANAGRTMTVTALLEAVMVATRRGGRLPATNCAKSETTRSLLLNCGESAEPIYLIKNLKY